MSRKPDPYMLDDDNPEWTAEDFARVFSGYKATAADRAAADAVKEQIAALDAEGDHALAH